MHWELNHHVLQWGDERSCWAFTHRSELASPEAIFFLLDSCKDTVDAQKIGRRIKQIVSKESPIAMFLLEMLDEEGRNV